jgi:thioredoxin-like negative regulator of GroEL
MNDKKIGISTSGIDISVGINAYKAYKAGDFVKAAELLLQVLDAEPRNWLARLYLGVCYYKTNQNFAAQRAFQFVAQNCPEQELKVKASRAMAVLGTQAQTIGKAPEFGSATDLASEIFSNI